MAGAVTPSSGAPRSPSATVTWLASVITTGRGATASGRVVTDQGVVPPLRASAVQVFAVPVGDDRAIAMPGSPPHLNDDFTFEVPALAEPRLFRASLPEGWTLRAVELDGQDVTDTPVDFRSGGDVHGLRVVITQQVSELSGLVTDDRGTPRLDATIVVFPDDETRWTENSRFIRSARPDQQGRYRVRGLAGARYLVATVDALDDGQLTDPDFLQSLRPAARSVTLAAGETKTFDVGR